MGWEGEEGEEDVDELHGWLGVEGMMGENE